MLTPTLLTLLAPALVAAAPSLAHGSPLAVDNLTEGVTVGHDLVLLEGRAPLDATSVAVRDAFGTGRWPARAGRFTAVAQLTTGRNGVGLAADGHRARFTLAYEPVSHRRAVRLVYLVAKDGTGEFMAPADETNDIASARSRIAFAGRLLQAVTAEKLREHGVGASTFRLLRDDAGRVDVHVQRASFTRAEAWEMDDHTLYQRVAGDLASLPDRDDTADVVLLAMTRFDAASGKPLAHTALGGGRLALFGSGGLYTWPTGIHELTARLLDARAVDRTRFFDDSAFRKTRWANFATGLGATLHELGHVFGLPHRDFGFMARGFDHINRTLTLVEPAGDTLRVTGPADESGWHPESARHLAQSPFFGATARAEPGR